MSEPVLNQPTLRKWMPICQAVGSFQNGDQEGDLSVSYLKSLIANLKKHPRQVPVYLSTGAPNPDHPDDLDERFADGWVEGLEMRGDWLYGDVKTHGQAAVAIANDLVRGASIGTVQGKKYDGAAIGPVLEHLVITNQPFVKGMNIAASRAKGGEPIAYHFTALSEAAMAKENKAGDQAVADPPDESLNLTEQLEAKEILLVEAQNRVKDLEAQNANLLEEVKAYKAAPDMKLAQDRIRQLERHNLAEKVRRLCAALLRDRQINSEALRPWADHDSNEVVLAGFKTSQFKGDINLLEFARASFPRNPSRQFTSGAPGGASDGELTTEDQKALVEANKDPEEFRATRGAKNFSEWKRRKEAAQKKGA